MKPAACASVLCLGLLVLTRPVVAQNGRAEARAHFEKALAHLSANELEPALAELQTAYRLQPHYAVLYDIGQVQLALGNAAAGVEALERYLEQGGSRVPADRRVQVQHLISEQSGKVSRLELVTSPEGASVRVDGKDRGKTPISALVLPGGHHEIDLELAGHDPVHRSLDLTAGASLRVEIPLAEEAQETAPLGTLEIDCPIPDVALSVDGREVAHTPAASLTVPLGTHAVLFRRAGYSDSHATVLATADGAMVRCHNEPLDPPPPATAGRLELKVPRAALVHVDGIVLRSDGRVSRGRHRVVVAADGFQTWESEVSVPKGRTLLIEPELQPDLDTLRQRQSQRSWAWALGATGTGLLATAGVMFFWNNSRYQDWQRRQESLDREWAQGPPRTQDLVARQTENDQLLLSVRAFDRVTIGLAAGGGALVATGAVLYFTGGDPKPRSRPTVTVERQGASLGWRVPW